MIYSDLAYRYASALFDTAQESKKTEQYFNELKALNKILSSDKAVASFISTPLIRNSDKEKSIEASFKGNSLSPDVINFVLLLARKGRLVLLGEVVEAYQACVDKLNNVARGTVQSSLELAPEQRSELANKIGSISKKKVELQFLVDKSLVGGLRAQVGSMTFDDSLSAHLKRIKDDLTRRIN